MILGPLEVRHGGGLVPVRGARDQAVLAVLLLEAGHVVPLARLVEAVWDGDPPQAAEKAVRNAVSALRSRFAQADLSQVVIETDPAGYRLRLGCGWLDAADFRRRVAASRELGAAGQASAAVEELRAGLRLWRGPALAGLGGLVIEAAAARLEEQRLAVWEDCLDLELRLGRHREITGELQRLADECPLRERVAGQLILALYRSGRQAEALGAYRQLAGKLAEELGIDPSAEVTRLHEAILRQDQALHLAAAPGPAEDSHPVIGNAIAKVPPPAHPKPAQLPLDIAGFTGRAAELARLHALLPPTTTATTATPATTATTTAAGGTVVISAIGGTAGVGKTALAIRFACQVADRFPDGQLYASLRGFDPSESPVAPATVLRGFLTALGVAAEAIPAGTDEQAALYRTLLAGKRVLILLDNARDAAQVRPLLPASPGCLVIVTSRNQLTGLAAAEGARPLTLDVLTKDEANDLLAARLGRVRLNADPGGAEELAALCAGLPLALAIVAARAAARPGLALADLAAELRDAHSLLEALDTGDPATDLRAVFSWSCRQLSDPAVKMFRLLGLHPGPDVTAPAAASLAAVPATEAAGLLSHLTSMHLLTERSAGRYSFHDLLRAYATEQALAEATDADRRAATHRMLDHYLHTAYRASFLTNPSNLPLDLAAPQPGTQPEEFTDHEQALGWFQQEQNVLPGAVQKAASAGFDSHAWQLPWVSLMYFVPRIHPLQLASMQRMALASAKRAGDPGGMARAHYGIGFACLKLGRRDEAHIHFSCAQQLYERLGELVGEAFALIHICGVLEPRARYRDGLGHAGRALELCRSAGHQAGEGAALITLGWLHAQLGKFRHAVDCHEQAIGLLREAGERQGEGHACDSLGWTLHRLGDYRQAIAHYHRALRLMRGIGARNEEAPILIHLGDTYSVDGDLAGARDAWQQAQVILDELRLPDAGQVQGKLAALEAEQIGARLATASGSATSPASATT